MHPDSAGVDVDRSGYIGACSLSVAVGGIVGTVAWDSIAVAALGGQTPLKSVLRALAEGAIAGAPLGAIAGLVAGLSILGWTRNDNPLLVGAQILLLGLAVVLWIAFELVENNRVGNAWQLLPLAGQLLLSVAGLAALTWAYQRRHRENCGRTPG